MNKVEQKKQFASINVSEKCQQEWKYTAKILNKPLSTFMSEISSQIIQITAILESANVSYVLSDDSLLIKFDGNSRVSVGKFQASSNSDADFKMNEIMRNKIEEDLKKEINIKPDFPDNNEFSSKHASDAHFYRGLD
jgi:hypothetical protein